MDDQARHKMFSAIVGHGMLSFKQAATLIHVLAESSTVVGDIVEFGVNCGRTACLMAACSGRRLWLYDSCQGFPDVSEHDGVMIRGGMAAPASAIEKTFAENHVEMPTLVQAFFCDVKPDQLPAKISFAHVDADLYASTLDALALVYPRLSVGGVVLLHDWNTEHLPGVTKAVNEFMADKSEKLTVPPRLDGVPGQQVYFTKQ